jgi:hypothetical protein
MKPLTKSLLLFVVVAVYSLLYLATSPIRPCDGSCQKLYSLDTLLTKKFDYVYGTFRCSSLPGSDTLCVYVRDTVGINWDRFADTVCLYANIAGLYQQKIFLIKNSIMPPDTVARRQCP